MNEDSNINRTNTSPNTSPYRGARSSRSRGRATCIPRSAGSSRGRGRATNTVSYSNATPIRGRGVTIPQTHYQASDRRELSSGNLNDTRNIGPRLLTRKINECENFAQLKGLFYGQKDKEYFDSVHANAFLGKLVNLNLSRKV